MFDFVAIDFETATNYIPCSLGIAVVKQSQVVEVRNWLIKPICFPYFHFYAQKIHGIHKEDVENEPTFDLIWNEVEPYLEDTIIAAHNASFDILAKKVWKESTKYSLDFLSNQEHIELNHHHSDSDAEACAKLLIKEAEYLSCNSFEELKHITKLRYTKV